MSRESLLAALRGRVSDRVVEAMTRVPRELFVPEDVRHLAYEDHPLPIGERQTISAPHMVAVMCDVLDIQPGMTILDVGTGSGYHAAVMAEMVKPSGHVHSIERLPDLAEFARRNLELANIANVTVVTGDGSAGLVEYAPYDRINVACTAPEVPKPLKEQLRPGGKLAIPVGSCYQELLLLIKTEEGFKVEHHGGVVFVPLIGVHGFRL